MELTISPTLLEAYATAEIARMRAIQTGHQVDAITGGLDIKEQKIDTTLS